MTDTFHIRFPDMEGVCKFLSGRKLKFLEVHVGEPVLNILVLVLRNGIYGSRLS